MAWVHASTQQVHVQLQDVLLCWDPTAAPARRAGEQAEKERQQKLAEKRERKVERQVAAGAIKKKKSKGIRIRKGVKIRVSVLGARLPDPWACVFHRQTGHVLTSIPCSWASVSCRVAVIQPGGLHPQFDVLMRMCSSCLLRKGIDLELATFSYQPPPLPVNQQRLLVAPTCAATVHGRSAGHQGGRCRQQAEGAAGAESRASHAADGGGRRTSSSRTEESQEKGQGGQDQEEGRQE